MKAKTRNALALIAIGIYIILTMMFSDNPMIRYYALLVIGAYELILSAIYYLLNRPMKPHGRCGHCRSHGFCLVPVHPLIWHNI